MFGLGPGKIEIKVNKTDFKPGETIEGTLTLIVKKQVKARAVKIALIGERRSMVSGGIQMGSGPSTMHNRSKTYRICNIVQELDGEKEYPATQLPNVYPFKIKIPEDVMGKEYGNDGAGQILGAMQAFKNFGSRTIWFLHAKLDVPMGMDVNKNLKLNITK